MVIYFLFYSVNELDQNGSDFIVNIQTLLRSKGVEDLGKNIPFISAIPTTAGTGSEGGKSAVITKPDGSKLVFGNPIFFPKIVALVPQFTVKVNTKYFHYLILLKLPPSLTAATGIDALFHCMEAYFVTLQDAYDDGCNDEDITRCDKYALEGIDLVIKNLPEAYNVFILI